MNRRDFLAVTSACFGSALLTGCEPAEAAPGSKDYDVLVVGGGIAGLTAAWYLRDSHSVRVLESGDRVGGKAIRGVRNGFSYPKGTEYLGEPNGALQEIITALKLTPREIPAPSDVHYYGGQFYYGGDGIALQMIRGSSVSEYNRFVKTIQDTFAAYKDVPELNLASNVAKLDDISARQWFNEHRFPALYQELYNVSAKGLFGATLDEISALSYVSELYFDYQGGTPVVSEADLENTATPSREKTYTYTFDHGIAEVSEALGGALKNSVQLNTTVTAVNADAAGGYRVDFIDGQGQKRSLTASVVILATPAPIALEMASSVLSAEQRALLGQIRYSSYVTAALFCDKPVFNTGFDLAVPDGNFFTDVYDSTWVQRHYNPDLQRQQDSIMSVYVAPPSYRDASIFDMSDREILDRIYQDLEKIYPGVRERVVGTDIHRFRHAYPVMTTGAYRRLTRLHEVSKGSLLLAGDYMIYPTFEAALESGVLAYELAAGTLKGRKVGS